MNKKILASCILFIMCITSSAYALEFSVPVWNPGIEQVSAEALGENFLNIECEGAVLIEQTTRKSFI